MAIATRLEAIASRLEACRAPVASPVPLLAALAPQLQQRLSADQLRAPHLAQVTGETDPAPKEQHQRILTMAGSVLVRPQAQDSESPVFYSVLLNRLHMDFGAIRQLLSLRPWPRRLLRRRGRARAHAFFVERTRCAAPIATRGSWRVPTSR